MSPIDVTVLATVPSGTERDVSNAIAAAEQASDVLADLTVTDRAEALTAVGTTCVSELTNWPKR